MAMMPVLSHQGERLLRAAQIPGVESLADDLQIRPELTFGIHRVNRRDRV